MTILLTRPHDASRRTAERLAAMGHKVLADPLLVLSFSPPPRLIGDRPPDAIVLTSANAAHAIEHHPDLARLAALPLWTVGSRTTDAARTLGFRAPRGEASDVATLAELLKKEPAQNLLYLAGEVRAGDLAALAPAHKVETCVVYSAVPKTELAFETVKALRNGRVTDVLHYSRRLAETYLTLAGAAGISDAALKPRQLCLSEQVAAPLRAAGAADVRAAKEPREEALLALLAA
jgi:uroporphyrinogen-III synthase